MHIAQRQQPTRGHTQANRKRIHEFPHTLNLREGNRPIENKFAAAAAYSRLFTQPPSTAIVVPLM